MAEFTPVGDIRGFLVPSRRISSDTLTAKTGSMASTYTEEGNRTGVPEPDQATPFVLAGSGTQKDDTDIEVYTQRGGHPGPGRAGMLWRSISDGDGATDYKGLDPPQLATGWDTLLWTTAATGANIRPRAITLASGQILVAYSVTTLGVVKIDRFDPLDESYTSCDLAPTGAGTGYLTTAAALMQLPSGRVVCYVTSFGLKQIDAYYSDDDGDTWTVYGYRVMRDSAGVGYQIDGISVAYSGGEVLLLAEFNDGANYDAGQWVSTSNGVAFDQVTSNWLAATSEEPTSTDVLPVAVGFVVAYIDRAAAGGAHNVRLFGSGGTAIDASEKVAIDSGAVANDACAWVGPSGSIYALELSGGTTGQLRRSVDGGATWDTQSDAGNVLELGASIAGMSAAAVAGRTMLAIRWTSVAGTTYDPASVGVVWLGGFTTHTAPTGYKTSKYSDDDVIAWGDETNVEGGIYMPVTVPGSVTWTMTGAGTEAQTADAELEYTTTAGQARYAQRTLGFGYAREVAFYEFAVEIDSGDGNTAAQEIAFRARFSSSTSPPGAFEMDFEIRLSSAGYQIYDRQAAANVSTVEAVDFTSLKHVRVAVDIDGEVATWWCSPGHVRDWTEGKSGTLNVAVAYTNPPLVEWGHLGAAANVSRWTMVGYCLWAGNYVAWATGSAAASWANPTDLHPMSYPTSASLIYEGARIATRGGLTRFGETQRIATRYDYPVSAVLPEDEQSPSVPWRTTGDEVQVELVFDLGGDATGGRFLNTSIGMAFLRSNVRTAKLEYYDGAWNTVLSLDAADGWDSLVYKRDGDVVYVDTGSASSSRWLPYGAAIGSQFQLDASTFRKIVEHSEGAWEDGTTKRPWVRIELSGGEPTTGTGRIIMQDSAVLRHEQSIDARYWRVLIPSQVTAAGYYQVGEIVVGHLVIVGFQWSRGMSSTRRANVEVTDLRDGQTRTTKRGRTSRVVEVAWTDGTDATALQGEAVSPDYVAGSTGGLPVAARVDGPRLVEGLLHTNDGPDRPMLFLPAIPHDTGSQMVTDPTGLLWARMGDEWARDNVTGEELISELERTGRLVLSEVV